MNKQNVQKWKKSMPITTENLGVSFATFLYFAKMTSEMQMKVRHI